MRLFLMYGPTARAATVLAVSFAIVTPVAFAQKQSDSTVTTMTGQVRKVELPASTSELQVAPVLSHLPVSTLGQLLSGRFAGLQVMSTGATGTGSRIRIRGQSSLLLGNDPLIIVDGVRLFQVSNNVSSPIPSRVDDINVEDIQEIEILSGPSGTTLYGSDAANGVINVTTKRGTAGKTRFNVYTENGLISDPHTYPDLWTLWGKRTGQTTSSLCTLALVSAKTCTVDSLSHGNVLNIDSLTPIDRGYRSQYGLQASGGSRRLQFFVAGEREDETGVFKIPARDVARLKVERGVASLPKNQIRPSALARNSVRVNLSAQPGSMLSLQLTSAYVNGNTRLVTSDESGTGIGYAATGGQWRSDLLDARGRPLLGYVLSAGDVMSQVSSQDIDRYINGVSATLAPFTWLSMRAAYGRDDATQLGLNYVRRNEGPANFSTPDGRAVRDRAKYALQTFDVGATATHQLSSWLKTRTSVGVQGVKGKMTRYTLLGTDALVNTSTPEAGTSYASSYNESENKSTGVYAEEELSFQNTIFVTGGVRRDQLSEYGVAPTSYPSVGVSWLLSDQTFFPKRSWLNTVRLRSAFGTASQVPGAEDEVNTVIYVDPFSSNQRPDAPKAEYSTEWEVGADLRLFGGASLLDLAYYNKKTKDVFVPLIILPSSPTYAEHGNGADIENRGVEVALQQRLASHAQFSASVTVTGSTNRNRLTFLRKDVPPIYTGNRTTEKNVPGYPLFGLWGRTYTYADANQDGIITASEMTFSDTAQFIAPSFPTRELAISPSVELLNHKLRFNAQIESKWGFKKFNNTLRHQCQMAQSCRGLNDKNAPLEEQAAAVAIGQSGVLVGMFEDASFTRLREASVSYELPTRWANTFRATGWNVVLAGRNLGVSTKYSGSDPEASVSTTDARQDEFFSTPLMRYYTLRFNFRF